MFVRIDLREEGIIKLTGDKELIKTISYSDKDYEKVYGDLLRELWDSGWKEVEVLRNVPANIEGDFILRTIPLVEKDGKVIAIEKEISKEIMERAMRCFKESLTQDQTPDNEKG